MYTQTNQILNVKFVSYIYMSVILDHFWNEENLTFRACQQASSGEGGATPQETGNKGQTHNATEYRFSQTDTCRNWAF